MAAPLFFRAVSSRSVRERGRPRLDLDRLRLRRLVPSLWKKVRVPVVVHNPLPFHPAFRIVDPPIAAARGGSKKGPGDVIAGAALP
jgi:hypothetical protein